MENQPVNDAARQEPEGLPLNCFSSSGLDQHHSHVLRQLLRQSSGTKGQRVFIQHATGLFHRGLCLFSGHSSLNSLEVGITVVWGKKGNRVVSSQGKTSKHATLFF